MSQFGVHSEVGKLRTVMVCRPGLAHQRLTPGNCHDLLFDDVIWVQEAQKDHYDFVLKMQERGVEVLDSTTCWPRPSRHPRRAPWCSTGGSPTNDRRVERWQRSLRPWLDEMPAAKLAEHLIGGIAITDLPQARVVERCWAMRSATLDFVMPPIPNTLFQRDPSCWIYSGVTCNPMFWPARKPETLLQRAVYKFHPRSRAADFKIWWGDSDEDFAARLDGGRRRHADRQGRRADRHGRAHHPPGGGPGRARAVREQGGHARDRLPDAEEPRGDASRHGVQLLRPRPRHRVPRGRRPDPLLQHAPDGDDGGIEVRADERAAASTSCGRRSA